MSLRRASKAARQAHDKACREGQLGRGIASTWSAPRRAKATERWDVEQQPGGLKTYRDLTPYQANESHFSEQERAAALRFVRDLELAGRIRIVSSRPYTGAPYAGPGDGSYLRSQAHMAAAERVDWILAHMDERWLALLDVVVCGVHYKLQDRPLTLAQLGAMLSRFTGKDQARACAVGFAKATFVRIDEAYAAWNVERRRRDKERERRRSQDMVAKADAALADVRREWDAARESMLKAYRREVLGQRDGEDR